MKRRIDFKSEDGAALVLEATIVYPIALVAVVFLIIWGVTFLQQGYLQYTASQLSRYFAMTVIYPGYDKIEAPIYEPPSGKTQLQAVNEAMNVHNPYRYIFGADKEIKDMIDKTKECMVESYAPGKGFMVAPTGSDVKVPDDLKKYEYQSKSKNGYACAIQVKKGFAEVYIGQNYVFADMFRIIGLGGTKMTIYGESLVYMSDSAEIVRVTDFGFDTVKMFMDKLGLTDKIGKLKEKIGTFFGKKEE